MDISKIKQRIQEQGLDYRELNYFLENSFENRPNITYMYEESGEFIVGITNEKGYRVGETKLKIQEEAEQLFFRKLVIDKQLYESYKKRGGSWPLSAI